MRHKRAHSRSEPVSPSVVSHGGVTGCVGIGVHASQAAGLARRLVRRGRLACFAGVAVRGAVEAWSDMSRSGRVGNCMATRCSRVRERGDARHRSLATVWRTMRRNRAAKPWCSPGGGRSPAVDWGVGCGGGAPVHCGAVTGFPSPETRVRKRIVACLVGTTNPATSQGRLHPGRWCRRSCVPRSCWSGSGCCGQGWLGGSFGQIGDAGGGDVAAFGGDQFVVDLDATWGTEERLTQEFG